MLFDGDACTMLAGPRVKTGNTHGTGCTTASAIAAELAKGASVPAAVRAAKEYVGCALAASAQLRIGSGAQRPFNHGCVHGWGVKSLAGLPAACLTTFASSLVGSRAGAGVYKGKLYLGCQTFV